MDYDKVIISNQIFKRRAFVLTRKEKVVVCSRLYCKIALKYGLFGISTADHSNFCLFSADLQIPKSQNIK